jgi:hypothetical protein
MHYTVQAEHRALRELSAIWMDATDRQAVRNASDKLDALLGTDPLSQGIPSGTARIIYVPPLAVVFSVSVEDRLVTITQYYGLA